MTKVKPQQKKYRIAEILDAMPVNDRSKVIAKILQVVPGSTYYRARSLSIDSKADIRVEVLVHIADCLKRPIHDLLTKKTY